MVPSLVDPGQASGLSEGAWLRVGYPARLEMPLHSCPFGGWWKVMGVSGAHGGSFLGV